MKLGRTITYLTKIVSIRYLIVRRERQDTIMSCEVTVLTPNVSFDHLNTVLFGLLVWYTI